MKIKINGKETEIADYATVADLMRGQNLLEKGGVAVAVGGKVVRKPEWGERHLAPEEEVLIINAAYGG